MILIADKYSFWSNQSYRTLIFFQSWGTHE